MGLSWRKFTAAAGLLVLLGAPVEASAVGCTTLAAMTSLDRNALMAAGGQLAVAVAQQDLGTLKAALLPAVASDWEGMSSEAQAGALLMKGGQVKLRSLYLLDATSLTAPANTQFFCSNENGSITVTLTMSKLPPGRYALVLADGAGAPNAGQLGLILAWDQAANGWRLGGLSVRPGALDGHDGLWWWTQARELAKEDQPWAAWYAYDTARALLSPVDFLSSPNLEKFNGEQAALQHTPPQAFPLTLPDGARTWKIDAVHLDLALLHPDLGVVYDSTGVADPAAQRTEAYAVLSALLKAQPGLRMSFHGLWAYALKDGKPMPIIELAMAQIP